MNFDRAKGTEGFTLIEVLVALSVVAVTLSAIGSLIAVTAPPSADTTSSSPTSMRWWSVAKRCATRSE